MSSELIENVDQQKTSQKERKVKMSKEVKKEERVLKQWVYDKVSKEYQEFLAELKKLSVEAVIEKAYEKVMKEEVVSLLYPDVSRLSDEQNLALLTADNTLERIYNDWLHFDGNACDIYLDSIEETSNKLIKRQK